MNSPVPIRLLIENDIPSGSEEATKEDITSGAPFPKASRVTAAIFWFILKASIIFVIAELKNISLVEERIKNSKKRKIIIEIEVRGTLPFIIQ